MRAAIGFGWPIYTAKEWAVYQALEWVFWGVEISAIQEAGNAGGEDPEHLQQFLREAMGL